MTEQLGAQCKFEMSQGLTFLGCCALLRIASLDLWQEKSVETQLGEGLDSEVEFPWPQTEQETSPQETGAFKVGGGGGRFRRT